MKGIIIYEDYRGKQVIEAIKLGMVNYECKSDTSDGSWINNLSGIRKESSQATCNKDDTYDFETGALIALMKMCGVDKVKKAAKETFFDVAENSVNEYEEKIHALEEEVKRLTNVSEGFYEFNGRLIDEIDQKNYEIISLKALKLSNESLKKDCKKYFKEIASLTKENGELKEDNKELKEKIEKLKLDCEKLRHGYLDTDMIFCGGRQNGKQYKALVELFKKIPKEKVQAAYVVAYKESLIWCTSQPSIRDSLTVDSLIEQSRAFTRKCVDEWLYKSPTKREEMWENIINVSQDPPVDIKVAKQDIKAFLKELQDKIPKARWNGSDCLPTEYTNPYWFKHDYIYFALLRNDNEGKLKLCYNDEHHSWIKTTIDYLPPMRWDLFKKGRIVVGVRKEQYNEFKEEINRQFGIINIHKPYDDFNYSFFIFDKNANFVEAIGRSQFSQLKTINGHKVYYWEDVR